MLRNGSDLQMFTNLGEVRMHHSKVSLPQEATYGALAYFSFDWSPLKTILTESEVMREALCSLYLAAGHLGLGLG